MPIVPVLPVTSSLSDSASSVDNAPPSRRAVSTNRSKDSVDMIVSHIDQEGDDKYRSMISRQPSAVVRGIKQSATTDSSAFDGMSHNDYTSMDDDDDDDDYVSTDASSSAPPPRRAQHSRRHRNSESSSVEGGIIPFRRRNMSAKRAAAAAATLPEEPPGLRNLLSDQSDYYQVKQKFAYGSVIISAIQVLVLMMQLSLCGVAPLDVNPMVGPYPDAFSEWQGKNAYFMKQDLQLWRFVTAAFLHVGVLHMLCNAVVQLETCAFFEREWGTWQWLVLYVVSEVGCMVVSCVVDPETVAVGSSGALMGLFGAKLAQVMSHTMFELLPGAYDEDLIRMDHLSGVLCSLAVISCLSFLNYIDWSGHMGGLAAGFSGGMVLFCCPIRNICIRILWGGVGLLLLGGGLAGAFYIFFTETQTDEDLADVCTYFRNLFAEGYDCECLWE